MTTEAATEEVVRQAMLALTVLEELDEAILAEPGVGFTERLLDAHNAAQKVITGRYRKFSRAEEMRHIAHRLEVLADDS